LKAYDANSLSCLILDVRMPEISGFQLQDRLKEIGADIPVIFVSGHGDIPMSVRALHNGAVDFLEKPYNSQQMLERIQMTLKNVAGNMQARERRQQLKAPEDPHRTRTRNPGEGHHGPVQQAHRTRPQHQRQDGGRASRQRQGQAGCQSTATLVRDVLMDFGPEFLKAA
jgi:DNA-binding response OmpR family regulator